MWFLEMARAFVDAGHSLLVLLPSGPDLEAARQEGRQHLRILGFHIEHEVAVLGDEEKPEYCRIHRVHILFDDNPKVIDAVSEVALSTICMLVK